MVVVYRDRDTDLKDDSKPTRLPPCEGRRERLSHTTLPSLAQLENVQSYSRRKAQQNWRKTSILRRLFCVGIFSYFLQLDSSWKLIIWFWIYCFMNFVRCERVDNDCLSSNFLRTTYKYFDVQVTCKFFISYLLLRHQGSVIIRFYMGKLKHMTML